MTSMKSIQVYSRGSSVAPRRIVGPRWRWWLGFAAFGLALAGCETPAPSTPATPTGFVAQPVPEASVAQRQPEAGATGAVGAQYRAGAIVTGRLRSVGSDTLDRVMGSWEDAFAGHHPGLVVSHEGQGSSTAVPALIEGRAEIGPMSRQVQPSEVDRFVRHFGYGPTQVRVGVDALGVYVHPDNPIRRRGMTVAELDSIFSSSRRRGHPVDITTWGQLGLGGEWANRPIKLVSRNRASGTYGFFREHVLDRGDFKAEVLEVPSSLDVIALVGEDRFAIGYSGIAYRTDRVAAVPISPSAGQAAVLPSSAAGVVYPLARPLYLTVNRVPGRPPSPIVSEFLRFVLSSDGQALLAADGFYPLDPQVAEQEQKHLLIDSSAVPVARTGNVGGVPTPEPATVPTQPASERLLMPDPRYTPQMFLDGRLRSVGSDTMDQVMDEWQKRFNRYHLDLRVSHEGRGSATGIPALIEDRADVAPLSRPLDERERTRFRDRFGYEPTQIRVAADALAIYVHPDNPLVDLGLDLARLDAIFSTSRKRGGAEALVRWGQLGLTGDWANQPIRVVARNRTSGTYGFFRSVVMLDGEYRSDLEELAGSVDVIKAVASDRYAIGFSGIGYRTDSVRVLPVAAKADNRPIPATEENVLMGIYPLSRYLTVVVNHQPNTPPRPVVHEFCTFVLGPVGQEVVEQKGFFPLPEELRRSELLRLR